ncbi:unnamed protein product [Peronospora belbahrii]|uniref:Uncharacterized protein n=1 Tax=Peronospora belbahrii TaxID=622444 RepID=A0AAU9L7V5_9STRA|nr:unnamed protein product [Peronospora belbahrii]
MPSNSNGLNGYVEETAYDKRSLRGRYYGMFGDQTGSHLQERDHRWHPLQDLVGSIDHAQESMHTHNRHGHRQDHDHESDDEYDFGDNNNDDDDNDDDDDDDDDDDKDDGNEKDADEKDHDDDAKDDIKDSNDRSNQSASDQNAQSSVLTKLDGINIGNTITIVNIGTAVQQAGNNGSRDNELNDNTLALNDSGGASVIFAGAQAFCGSIGCNSSQRPLSTDNNSSYMSLSTMPSVAGSNVTKDDDVRCKIPAMSNESNTAAKWLAKWLLLVAVFIELRRF